MFLARTNNEEDQPRHLVVKDQTVPVPINFPLYAELEAEGIVARTVIPSTPVRVEYRLTAKGRALAPVLDAIGQWAGDWLVVPAEPAAASRATPTPTPR